MKIHRFIIPGICWPKLGQNFTIADRRVFHQAKNVLKLRIGESIIVCDGLGKEAEVIIGAYDKNNLVVQTGDTLKSKVSSRRSVTLFCALLKKENFELVVQKATEIGVEKIVPIISERTIKTSLNMPRLFLIALEASEQSGRAAVPEIAEPMAFKQALAFASKKDIFFAPGGIDVESVLKKADNVLNIFIGPEGGWSEAEVALAKETKLSICALGPTILRGETAALVASYLAVNF